MFHNCCYIIRSVDITGNRAILKDIIGYLVANRDKWSLDSRDKTTEFGQKLENKQCLSWNIVWRSKYVQ